MARIKSVARRLPHAVDLLEARKHQQQFLEVIDGEPAVDPVERMRHRRDHVFFGKVPVQGVDVGARLLDHPELRLVDAENEHVDLAAVLGEVGGDLAGQERVFEMGDFQRAAEAVVVGNGDEIQAALLRPLVNFQRLGK